MWWWVQETSERRRLQEAVTDPWETRKYDEEEARLEEDD